MINDDTLNAINVRDNDAPLRERRWGHGKNLAALHSLGAVYVGHIVKTASSTNNVFALVLGLLAFLYLTSVAPVLRAEVNAVRVDRLYPRALLTPFTDNVSLTSADRKAYTDQAKAQRAKGFEHIAATFHFTTTDDVEAQSLVSAWGVRKLC